MTSQHIIIIESNDPSETIETIQELTLMQINANVYTREEVIWKQCTKNFEAERDKLLDELKLSIDNLAKYETNSKVNVEKLKKILFESLLDIKKFIEKSKNRTIKLAVFATKKSGKSMLVNALLGEEYAPTSLELATPNAIEYIPHDGKLSLEYKNNIIEFDSPLKLKEYIKKEFQEVNKDAKELPVMRIYYPKKDNLNFLIYDTPGPDLAGAEGHKKIAEKYIKEADAAVFIIDYSKYAQESEVKLLENLKELFEKHRKLHSLIIAINKIDLMFSDTDTEKIKNRVAYFIKEVFKKKGIKNFFVLPISAMLYFYTKKLIEKIPEIKEEKDLLSSNLLRVNFYKKREVAKEIVKFIKDNINTLTDVLSYESVTINDLIKLSNFEFLKNYIFYIVNTMAYLEKVRKILTDIEVTITKVNNYINSSKLLAVKEVEKIKKILNEFIDKIVNIADRKISNDLQNEIEKTFENFEISLQTTQYDLILNKIEKHKDNFFKRIKNEIKSQLNDTIKKKNPLPEIGKLTLKLKKCSFKFSEFVEVITKEDVEKLIKSITELLNREIRKIKEEIDYTTVKISKELESEIHSLYFKLDKIVPFYIKNDLKNIYPPKLSYSIPVNDLIKKIINEIRNLLTSFTLEFDASTLVEAIEETSFLKKLLTLFLADDYEINEKKFNKLFEDLGLNKKFEHIFEIFLSNIDESLSKKTNDMLSPILKNLKEEIKTEMDKFVNSLLKPVELVEENLNSEKTEKEKILELIRELESNLINFNKIWEYILAPIKEVKNNG